MKYVKSRYDVIEMSPTTLTIENRKKPRQALTPLTTLLAEQGCADEVVNGIIESIERISADKVAQANKGGFGKWVPV